MATKEVKAVKKTVAKKEPKVASKAAGISVDSYSAAGVKGTTNLPEAIFGQKTNRVLLAQATRVFLSNQRSAQAKTKGRGEIRYSTAKIYRQKGTGNARHGDKAAPIFVGGGIAHGPNGTQNYKMSLSKVLKKKALVSALSTQVAKGKVVVADLGKIEAKTKDLSNLVKKMGIKFPAVLVYSQNANLERAGRNLSGITLVPADQVTAYQVLCGKQLVVTPDAIEVIEKRVMAGEK
jgi:large subunit ribosomal protein L4